MNLIDKNLIYAEAGKNDKLPLYYLLEQHMFSNFLKTHSLAINHISMNPTHISSRNLLPIKELSQLQKSSRQKDPDATISLNSLRLQNDQGFDVKFGNLKYYPGFTLHHMYLQDGKQLSTFVTEAFNLLEYKRMVNKTIQNLLITSQNFSIEHHREILEITRLVLFKLNTLNYTNLNTIVELQNLFFSLQKISNEYDVLFLLPQLDITNIESSSIIQLGFPLNIVLIHLFLIILL